METKIIISGFADEIDVNLENQLKVVRELGMDHICIRAVDGKNIADYTFAEFQEQVYPRLQRAGVKVSSLGSPLGKIDIDDESSYQQQLQQLDALCRICKLVECKYIRIFSFWMKEKHPEDWTAEVLRKLRAFVAIAEKYDVILLHENEKDIYGDTGARCKVIMDALASPHFRAAYDFANFVQCGEDPESCYDLLKEYISYIHVKDATAADGKNVLCGTGDGKIAAILKKAIREDRYSGFLTLEPHLFAFATLQSLEKGDVFNVISKYGVENGAAGYAAQYHALCEILETV